MVRTCPRRTRARTDGHDTGMQGAASREIRSASGSPLRQRISVQIARRPAREIPFLVDYPPQVLQVTVGSGQYEDPASRRVRAVLHSCPPHESTRARSPQCTITPLPRVHGAACGPCILPTATTWAMQLAAVTSFTGAARANPSPPTHLCNTVTNVFNPRAGLT